ncbi:hypothetical protein D9M72_474630 [compost metagenome]
MQRFLSLLPFPRSGPVHEVPPAACPRLRRDPRRVFPGGRPGRISVPARAPHRALRARRIHGRAGPRGGRRPAQGTGPERGGGKPRGRGRPDRHRGRGAGAGRRLHAGHGDGQHHGRQSAAVRHPAGRSGDAIETGGAGGDGAGRVDGEPGVPGAGLRAIPGRTSRASRQVFLRLAGRGLAGAPEPGGHERRPESGRAARAVPRHGAGADRGGGRGGAGAAGPVRVGAIADQGRQAARDRRVRARAAGGHAGTAHPGGAGLSAVERAGPDLVRPGRAGGHARRRSAAPEPGRGPRAGRPRPGAAPGGPGRAAGSGHAAGIRRAHCPDAGRQPENH